MILDSGARTEFSSGAVRDVQGGKGRCDLLPVDIVADLVQADSTIDNNELYASILKSINLFIWEKDPHTLLDAILAFTKILKIDLPDAILLVSKHFQNGAAKYGERNWEKGLPIHSFIDSALRHLFKYMRGDADEPHGTAFMWNLMCCMWIMRYRPDMQDIPNLL